MFFQGGKVNLIKAYGQAEILLQTLFLLTDKGGDFPLIVVRVHGVLVGGGEEVLSDTTCLLQRSQILFSVKGYYLKDPG